MNQSSKNQGLPLNYKQLLLILFRRLSDEKQAKIVALLESGSDKDISINENIG